MGRLSVSAGWLSRRRGRLGALALVALLAVLALAPSSALAWYPPGTADPVGAPGGTPTLVASMTAPPSGYRLTGRQVLAIARANPFVAQNLRGHPHYVPYVYTLGAPNWEVGWFANPNTPKSKELIEVYIDDGTGQVTQAWTGIQVGWTMARGYAGAFGRKINRWYIWVLLCAAFLLPFVPWRRRPSLWHLDLLVLLSFSLSLDAFNQANIGLSVGLSFPPMLYLLVRCLLLASGRGLPRTPLRPLVPAAWLAIGLVFLVGFRIGLNVTNSNVIDVGYSGVIGSYDLIHGKPMYGTDYPAADADGDTYGPVNYYAYVPATAAFGWSGGWDNLPAAHAAAIAFDLLTMLALFLLGRSVRGPTTGITLAYLWAAYPFTAFALCCNVNDSLVALLIVLALLAMRSPPGRGVLVAWAGLTKYVPLALAPLMLRGAGPPPDRRRLALSAGGFALAFLVAMAPIVLSGDLNSFWHDSILFQLNRPAPFSIWSVWSGFAKLPHLTDRRIVLGLAALVALGGTVWPRGNRSLMQVAALCAAVILLVECSLSYWLYTYIMWFFAAVLVALVLAFPPAPEERSEEVAAA